MTSVDLPMPGSPPSKITEPGTKPPPVTRSSSAMPVVMRGGGRAICSRSGSKGQKPGLFARPAWLCAPMPEDALSSAMVFHPPQASQRPCQRWLTAPQFWQTKEA